MTIQPIDTSHTTDPICPHCGRYLSTSELCLDDGETLEDECGWCGRVLTITAHVTVRYTTRAKS